MKLLVLSLLLMTLLISPGSQLSNVMNTPLRSCLKALYDINVPSTIQVKRREDIRTLRSSNQSTRSMVKCNDNVPTFQLKLKGYLTIYQN